VDGRLDTGVEPDRIRSTVTVSLAAGATLRLDKFIGYAWDDHRDPAALCEAARAARDDAARAGFEALVAEQCTYLDDFWDAADVEIDGDPEVQQAVRFGLFHVLQAGAQAGPAARRRPRRGRRVAHRREGHARRARPPTTSKAATSTCTTTANR
jgi:trehalose/maltose hydrolase-like predicted phosphorylase